MDGKESEKLMTETLLCIDTSTPTGSVAIVDSKGVLAGRTRKDKAAQAEKLFTTIGELTAECGVRIEEFSGVAVACGPGSFTGLRIAASTAKTLAWVTGKPLYAVGSLMSLAFGAADHGPPVLAMFDARQNELYAACYRWSGTSRCGEELLAPCALNVEKLSRLIPDLSSEGKIICLGQGFRKNQATITNLAGEFLRGVSEKLDQPNAEYLGKLVLASPDSYRVKNLTAFQPAYLRMGQAGLRLGQ